MSEIIQLVTQVGVTSTIALIAVIIIFLIANALVRHFDRRSKVEAHHDHSHLDDTETLRELSKEDRDLLRLFQTRNDDLTKSNISMIQENAKLKTDFELLKQDTTERMKDSAQEQARLSQQIDQLKKDVVELREQLRECFETSKIKDDIISRQNDELGKLRSA